MDYSQLPHNKILCVDMKSFYASVEAVDRGLDPFKVCLAVIGDKNRKGSVVLAASPALKKKYNIKTGNRLFEIPKTKEIILVEARMGLYVDRSIEIVELFNDFVPLDAIHVYSIDESWLKLDGSEKLFGDKWEMAEKIKKAILDRFNLPCSMGIGPNMFLAKVAMDIEGKKKGITEWAYEDVPKKLWPVKLKNCWGIGSRISNTLNKIGVKTVGDLAHLPLEYLEKKYGIMGNQLYYHAWGVDLSKLEGHYEDQPKGLSRGITLLRDYKKIEEIKTVIFDLCDIVAGRAREKMILAKTVSLGVGYSHEELTGGFYVQRSLRHHSNLLTDIYSVCLELFTENYKGEIVRKVHVSISNFIFNSKIQLNLFANKEKEINISQVKDSIQEKYGFKALFYARSLKKGGIRERVFTTIGGHKV